MASTKRAIAPREQLLNVASGLFYTEGINSVGVERILQECYADGLRLLREHRDALDRLAATLLERETLDEQEIIKVTGIRPAPREAETVLAGLPAAAFTAND